MREIDAGLLDIDDDEFVALALEFAGEHLAHAAVAADDGVIVQFLDIPR